MVNTGNRNEHAFTGLEAAIVLIAFVTVAAVFAYVVIGAGFFTTQKSQEVIHTGIGQASSALMLAGSVYGVGTPGSTIDMVNFSISVASGGTPIDIEKVVITYSDKTHLEKLAPVPGYFSSSTTPGTWAITERQNERGISDNVLDKGELFSISAHPTTGIGKDTEFSIEVAPAGGATMQILRTAPSAIYAVNQFY
ncbi:archaellin/type IV pilin N-terminal domain-containing protein [uncultured Methanoregula sp.]|uniref:archaellin/type IV pilin N-terminal domain-containing protein n=1 Tax=uncultured Methanoregula sp. TaxID=1005933 RepID=UPI002AAAF8C9|nr:archaellin/type IV pilin N-terminal domain-containing protein [uncultured Methanoregula sp.]